MIRQALAVAMALGLAGLMAPYALDLGPDGPLVPGRQEIVVSDGMVRITQAIHLPGGGDGGEIGPQDHKITCGGMAPFKAKCRRQDALTLKGPTPFIIVAVETGFTGIVQAQASTDTGYLIQECRTTLHNTDTPLDSAVCTIEASGHWEVGQTLTLRGRTQTVDHPQPSVGEWLVGFQNKGH